ncbi:MAG: NMT1/THI5 like protein [Chloroflexi bacterium ADurb.Bin325]|nr:MAG: NMT1/THI5 like protein [Chloroflexi bacterium ADurb.Bin325]
MFFRRPITALFLLLVLALAGCVPVAAPADDSAAQPAPAAQAEDGKLKIALIPVLDIIPIFVAQQNGYFEAQGIQVETVPVKSPQERDVLIQTGQADAVLTDLQSVGLLNKEQTRVKAVYTARRPFPHAPLFRILAAPGSNIATPADLKGVPIGISNNTIIEYLTDRILAAEGLAPGDIAKIEVGAITVRYEQLMNGNIRAAVLPDPLAQGAIAAGATLVVDDSGYAELSQSVLTFTTDALAARPQTVTKFLAAWEQAVAELNAHPEQYRAILIEQGRVPQNLQDSYEMPPFPTRGVPTETEVADVIAWLKEKGLVTRDLAYTDMVDAAFLPK